MSIEEQFQLNTSQSETSVAGSTISSLISIVPLAMPNPFLGFLFCMGLITTKLLARLHLNLKYYSQLL